MRKLLATHGVLAGLFLTLISPSPAIAVVRTIYIAPTGSVGEGSSCASPGYVGGSSIATAVGAAADGDTIILCDGTFNVSAQIFINNKELTISGQTSATNTIINGSTSTTGIFRIVSQKSVKLEKITFLKGQSLGYGGAILMSLTLEESLSTTRHVITNNIFVQNRSEEQGGAINASGNNMGTGDFQGILTISNNTFVENYAAVDGGAIVMAAVAFDPTRIVIDSNKFLYNRAGNRAAGAVVSNFNRLTSTDNIYYLNTSGDAGNAQTLYGGFKIGGDIIMNDLSNVSKDCRVDDLEPTITRTTKVDNPNCEFFDGRAVTGLTTITRAEGLALSGIIIPQSPLISSSAQDASTATLTLGSRDSGGLTILNYSYSLDGASYVNFPAGNSSSQTITGLNAGTSYTVKLKATTSAGTSYESASHSFTTSALPADAPVISTVSAGDLSLTISFTLGTDNGSPASNVWYSLNAGSYISTGGVTSPIVITSLTGRRSYSVRIKAQNAAGYSSESNLKSATTLDLAQDASDAAAVKEAERIAEKERVRKISEARERVLAAVRSGAELLKADLLAGDYSAVVESTVDSMLRNIPNFARGESTTAEDLIIASKAVNVIQKLGDEEKVKRVNTTELSDVGIEAFSSNFKVRILLGVVASPVDQRDSISEITALADSLLQKFQERREKIIAIGLRISNARNVKP